MIRFRNIGIIAVLVVGLAVGLAWWILGMALAAIYFVLIYRLFWGKVRPTEVEGY